MVAITLCRRLYLTNGFDSKCLLKITHKLAMRAYYNTPLTPTYVYKLTAEKS